MNSTHPDTNESSLKNLITRREAMRDLALILGGTLSAPTLAMLFSSCGAPPQSGKKFDDAQQALVTSIADVIIPTTDTPGAKAAGVGPFITMMIIECYPEEVQRLFTAGLESLEKQAQEKFNASFLNVGAQKQQALLQELADQTIAQKKADAAVKIDPDIGTFGSAKEKPKAKVYFFQLIRELTLLGYFTSEIGATKALVYLPVPGKYDGDIPYKPGEKAWAL